MAVINGIDELSLRAMQAPASVSIPASGHQSAIPSPVAKYGYAIQEPSPRRRAVVYDGTFLPRFLLMNGIDPNLWRTILLDNKVGSVFDLEPGTQLFLPLETTKDRFSTHPEA